MDSATTIDTQCESHHPTNGKTEVMRSEPMRILSNTNGLNPRPPGKPVQSGNNNGKNKPRSRARSNSEAKSNTPEQKKAAQKSHRTQKKNNRGAAQTVTALANAILEQQGELDAVHEIIEENKEIEVPTVYYVNRLAMFHSTNRSQHIFQEQEGGQLVIGNFKFPNEKETISINRFLPYAPANLLEAELSSDLYLVRSAGPHNGEINAANYRAQQKLKVREILLTLTDVMDLTVNGNYSSILKSARSHYLRHNPIYPQLNSDIHDEYYTDIIQDSFKDKINRQYLTWRSNTENKCRAVLARQGKIFEIEYEKFCYDNNYYNEFNVQAYVKLTSRSTITKLAGAAVLGGVVSKVATLWNYLPSSITAPVNKHVSVVVPMVLATKVAYDVCTFNPVSEDESLRRFATKVLSEPVSLMAPCATAYLKRTNFTREMPAIISPDVVLSVSEECIEKDDKDVHTYGTFVNGPAVFPSQTAKNLEAAIRMRLASTDFGNPTTQRELLKFGKNFVEKLPNFELPAFTDEENLRFLSETYGNKKGVRYFNLKDDEMTEKLLECDMFVKDEVYLGKTVDDYKPRMIFARNPAMIAKFGVFFNALGKELKSYFNKDSDTYYTASSTPTTLGVFFDKQNSAQTFRYESDVSSWDGCLSKEMLAIELHFLRTRVSGLPHDFSYVMERWFNTEARGCNSRVKLSMSHGRKSGDLWTSMFNSLLNIIITHFIISKINPNIHISMMVMGDDNAVWLSEQVNPDSIVSIYKELGMKCEVLVNDDEHFSYCSGLFYATAYGSVWGVKPFRQIAKLGLNPKGFPKHLHQRLLYGTAKGMLSIGGHVPILGAFLRAIIRTSRELRVKEFVDKNNWRERIDSKEELFPDCETYSQFSVRYGMSYEEIKFVEAWLTENISVDNFPMQASSSIFLDGFNIDVTDHNSASPYEVIDSNSLSIDTTEPFHDVVQIIPIQEELSKLDPTSFRKSIENAIKMGMEEDRMLGTSSHTFLHVCFTTVSYFNINLGIKMHQAYNRLAMNTVNLRPCSMTSGRKKKGVERRNQQKNTVVGPGIKFVDAVKKVAALLPRGSLAAAGMAAGGALGGVPGSAIGGTLGRAISSITGYGDFEISENSLVATGDKAVSVPSFGSETTIIKHREFVRDIPAAGTAFTNYDFMINPGLAELFPWLSQFANSYDQYQILGMVVEFVSTFSDITAGGNLGTVMIATDYDATDDPYPNKITLENAMFSCSAKPSLSLIHAIECDPAITFCPIKYLRKGSHPDGTDARLYDWGRLQLATQNLPVSSGSIGELWVTYEIAFYKPQLAPALCRSFDYFQLPQTVSASHYLGADTTTVYYGTSGSSIGGYVMNSTYYFPTNATGSKFLFNIAYRGSATTITTQLSLTDTNCTSSTDFYGNGTGCTPHAGYGAPQSGALNCTSTINNITFQVDADGASVTVSAGTLPTSIIGADLFVLQYA